jgi:hypothetical protein
MENPEERSRHDDRRDAKRGYHLGCTPEHKKGAPGDGAMGVVIPISECRCSPGGDGKARVDRITQNALRVQPFARRLGYRRHGRVGDAPFH